MRFDGIEKPARTPLRSTFTEDVEDTDPAEDEDPGEDGDDAIAPEEDDDHGSEDLSQAA